MNAYCDTSFLVSLYTLDGNSEVAAQKLRARSSAALILSRLGELELTNAFQQRIFRREFTAPQIRAAHKLFAADLAEGILAFKPVEADAVYLRGLRLARKWTSTMGARTLDLLHVAIALEMGMDGIFTFDKLQSKVCRGEGLRVF